MDSTWKWTSPKDSFLQLKWLDAIHKRLNNEIPSSLLENEVSILSSEALSQRINQDHLLQWTDLSLLYHVSNEEGWYMTPDLFCYYIVIGEENQFSVVYPHIPLQVLMIYVLRVSEGRGVRCSLRHPLV